MEIIIKSHNPETNFREYKDKITNIIEQNKINNNYISEISPKDKMVLDNSLKELRREIKEMSDNINKLNNETDKYIYNRNNINHFSSNSLNLQKISNNEEKVSEKIQNNNYIYNDYAYNNLKNDQINFLKKNKYYQLNKNNSKNFDHFSESKNIDNWTNNNYINESYQNIPDNSNFISHRSFSVDNNNQKNPIPNANKKVNLLITRNNYLIKEALNIPLLQTYKNYQYKYFE